MTKTAVLFSYAWVTTSLDLLALKLPLLSEEKDHRTLDELSWNYHCATQYSTARGKKLLTHSFASPEVTITLVLITLALLLRCSCIALPSLFHHSFISLPLLFHHSCIALSFLFHYSSISSITLPSLPLLFHYSSIALPLLLHLFHLFHLFHLVHLSWLFLQSGA